MGQYACEHDILICKVEETHYLNAKIRCCGTDQSEGRADVYALNDVPGVVWGCVQHTVIREAGIVHNMIQLAILPV